MQEQPRGAQLEVAAHVAKLIGWPELIPGSKPMQRLCTWVRPEDPTGPYKRFLDEKALGPGHVNQALDAVKEVRLTVIDRHQRPREAESRPDHLEPALAGLAAVSLTEDTPGDGPQSQVLPAADGAGDVDLLRREDETVRLATVSLAGQPPEALVAAVKARHPGPDEQRRVLDRIRQAASCASVDSPAAERPSPATNAVDPPSVGCDGSDGLVAPGLVSSPGVRAL